MTRHRQIIKQAVDQSRRRSIAAQLWSNEGSDPIESLISFAAKVREDHGYAPHSPHQVMMLERIEQHMREHPEEYKAQIDSLMNDIRAEEQQADEQE